MAVTHHCAIEIAKATIIKRFLCQPFMATFSTLATALELMSVDTLVAGVRYAAAHQHVLCRLISSSDCFDHDMPPPQK